MHVEWHGVSDFVVLSVVKVCVDYGGVNVFHVCLDFFVFYGVGICVNVCGVVCVVCCLFLMSVCMLTVSNALLMSSATVIVRSGVFFWLKPVAMVLFMFCIAVLAFEAMLCGDMWDVVCNVWD